MRVLVTGATGFVGRALVGSLVSRPIVVRAAVRRSDARTPDGVERVVVPGLAETTDWSAALDGVNVVVHAAARVHIMRETASNPLAEFRRVNVGGTLRLARQAAAAGVRRFVFVSSIKVNGDSTAVGRPFTPEDAPAPSEAYGLSKLEAERGLAAIAAETGMQLTVVRPVLIYGPGAKGNFASLLRWTARGVPLPLGAVENRRSLVALDNLVDLLARCLDHPQAANQIFLVSDGEDLSTTDLLSRVARALGRRPRLLPIPTALLWAAAKALGRRTVAQRLLGNLVVDITKTRELLGWIPPIGVNEALAKAVAAVHTD